MEGWSALYVQVRGGGQPWVQPVPLSPVSGFPVTSRRSPNFESMLGHCRCWLNDKSALGQRLVFVWLLPRNLNVSDASWGFVGKFTVSATLTRNLNWHKTLVRQLVTIQGNIESRN